MGREGERIGQLLSHTLHCCSGLGEEEIIPFPRWVVTITAPNFLVYPLRARLAGWLAGWLDGWMACLLTHLLVHAMPLSTLFSLSALPCLSRPGYSDAVNISPISGRPKLACLLACLLASQQIVGSAATRSSHHFAQGSIYRAEKGRERRREGRLDSQKVNDGPFFFRLGLCV